MFGEPLYPTIADKAAFLMFSVISNHVFQDGNKRTGLEAALLFLKLNGYKLKTDLKNISISDWEGILIEKGDSSNSNELLINFTLEVASGQIRLDGCKLWFAENIEMLK